MGSGLNARCPARAGYIVPMNNILPGGMVRLIAFLCLLEPSMSFSQSITTYRQPPDPIPSILDAPRPAGLTVSPDGRWAVESTQRGLAPVAELAAPAVETGGLRLDPRTNGPMGEAWQVGMSLVDLQSLERRPVWLPEEARFRDLSWSPDSRHVAWRRATESGCELWVTSVADGSSRRLGQVLLNSALASHVQWLPDSRGLLCLRVPPERGAPPQAGAPEGPEVLENQGRTAASRTYPFLIRSPHDERLLEYYAGAELVRIGLDGEVKQVAPWGLVLDFDLSPDGRFLQVGNAVPPWSRSLPVGECARRDAVLDLEGREVYRVADLPSTAEVSIRFGSVRPGPRRIHWRPDQPATLVWVEALDGGDGGAAAPERDALQELSAPFQAPVRELARFQDRIGGLVWGEEGLVLLWETWHKDRRQRVWRLDAATGVKSLLVERNSDDAYSEPGWPLTVPNAAGLSVLKRSPDRKWIYWSGRGAGPEGVHPFLDRMRLRDGKRERLWECRDPWYEAVEKMLDDKGERLLVSRQSPTVPENTWLLESPGRDSPLPRSSGDFQARQVTLGEDPAPMMAGLQQEILTYQRADGVELSATLYLPAGYRRGVDPPLPTILWAYPREYRTREATGRVTTSEFMFSRPAGTSVLFMLTQGYAVLADPGLPILGEGGKEPNDSYLEQLVAGAGAAVAELARLGVSDTSRLAIGGHSYGAFTAANLLAHTEFFKTAICFSGAYNRSLTPFGFQGEDRSWWEAPDTYREMSPFFVADRIKRPILLVHGMADPNSGTFPLQSDRFFEALKGLGATARLVRLPAEGHGYRARESVGHVLWELATWCDTHVKHASTEGSTASPTP